jgi:hypothetical protein
MKSNVRGSLTPLFLKPGISWKWVVSLAPRPLYPWGKNSGTRSVEGRVGHGAGWDALGKRISLAAEVNRTTVTWTRGLWLRNHTDYAMSTVDMFCLLEMSKLVCYRQAYVVWFMCLLIFTIYNLKVCPMQDSGSLVLPRSVFYVWRVAVFCFMDQFI